MFQHPARRPIGGGVCLLPGQQQDGSIAASCEIDGLQAVCVAGLIEFPPQTPVVWTGACHSPHTHSHSHSRQALCLYLN